MSKKSKQARVSVRTHHVRARSNPHEDDGWPDWDCPYVSQDDDPEAAEILWDAFIQIYSARERLVVRTILRCWDFWMDVPQRAHMVHDVIRAELWMLHGLPRSERARQAQAAARAIWEAVVSYGNPRRHRELDLENVYEPGEYSFCRDDRDECLREIESLCRWHAHSLQRVRFERC